MPACRVERLLIGCQARAGQAPAGLPSPLHVPAAQPGAARSEAWRDGKARGEAV